MAATASPSRNMPSETPPDAPLARPRGALAAVATIFWDRDRTIALLALALVAYYVGTRGIYQGKASGDGFFGFMYLPAAVYHHSLDIGPTVPQWIPYLGREPTGHVPNACPIGPVIFWVPTYLVALAVEKVQALVTHAAPAALPGQTAFDFWMAGLGSLAAGLAGIALMYRLLRRKLGDAAARFGTIAAVLATPLTWYLVTQPLYQHACAFFAVTLLVERWDAWRAEGPLGPKRLLWLGLMGGLAMTMRLQEAVWLLLPGLDVADEIVRAARRRDGRAIGRFLLGGVLLGVGALIAFSPQAALWRWFFGFFRPPQPPGHMRWGDPAIVAMIFSIRGGLLAWTPSLYLLIPGLFLGRRVLGGLAWRLALIFAIEVWVNAAAWDHWGSWTYGARRFTDGTVIFGAAFGGLWAWASERPRPTARRTLLGLFVFFIAYNVFLMELVRGQRIKSSGAGAFPASTWVSWAKGPDWLGRAFDRVGYPFVQPAGWIYGLVYDVPPKTFEGVVGGYLLDRDSRIHAVLHDSGLDFANPGEHVPEGIAGPPSKDGMVPVSPRVRVLVPIPVAEPLGVRVSGAFGGREGAVHATWNGHPLMASPPGRGEARFDVPGELVHTRSRTNQLVLELPAGASLKRLDLESRGTWWR